MIDVFRIILDDKYRSYEKNKSPDKEIENNIERKAIQNVVRNLKKL